MAKKLALGKGIASLLQDTSTPQSVVMNAYQNLKDEESNTVTERIVEKEVVKIEHSPLMVHVESIKTNPDQPRKIFKEKELEELAESIKENGILQPLVVVEMEDGQFELVAGERRLRAAKKIGMEQVPVIVKRATDKEKAIYSIIENIQRSDLNHFKRLLLEKFLS